MNAKCACGFEAVWTTKKTGRNVSQFSMLKGEKPFRQLYMDYSNMPIISTVYGVIDENTVSINAIGVEMVLLGCPRCGTVIFTEKEKFLNDELNYPELFNED